MSEFTSDIDIANRACQHCGVTRIDPAQGFNENSKRAKEIESVYDKLRRAELERNIWRFSIRLAVIRAVSTGTMKLSPSLWDASVTYFVGSIVADGNGALWISRQPNNLAQEPGASTAWQLYFGTLTVEPWATGTAYASGEVVYTAAGDGTSRVYLSLQNANEDTPATATAWAATSTYSKNQVVTYLSVGYMSLIDLNTNNTPSTSPLPWSALTTYAIGNSVGASNGVIYTSVTNGNLNNDPVSDNGTNWTNTGVLTPWISTFTGGAGSLKWLQIGGAEFPNGVALETLNLIYPLGTGPAQQATSRNVFHLPAGYVKYAPQDPKAGSVSWLGAPGNRAFDDWDFQDEYIVSADGGPITFRFAADIADVRQMSSMFCEVLGARIGLEVCQPLTQSTDKMRAIAQSYDKFRGDAVKVNAIETGPVEDALDDYLACRA